MLERELEAWARDEARAAGCLLLKFTSPGRAGVPDRILIAPGGTVFIEFKQLGKQPTPLQRAMMKKITRAGGVCYVCDRKDTFTEILSSVSG